MAGFDYTTLVTGGVGALTVAAAWIGSVSTGKFHTDDEFQRECQRGAIKDATITELRAAVEAANSRAEVANARADAANTRADSAVEATKIVAQAVMHVQKRRSRAQSQASP